MNKMNEDLLDEAPRAAREGGPAAAPEIMMAKPERTPASPASVILPAVPSNDLAPIFLGRDGISSSSSSSSSPTPENGHGEELTVEAEAEGPVVATVLDKKLEMLTQQRLARERLMTMTQTQTRMIQQKQRQQHQQVSGNSKPTVTPSLADLARRAPAALGSPKKASSSNKTSPPAAPSLADLARTTRTTGQSSPEKPSTKNSLAILAEAAAAKKKENESEASSNADVLIPPDADSTTTNLTTGNTIAAMQGRILSKLDKQKSTREIVLQKQKEFAIERAKDIQKNDEEEAEANTCTTHHLADKQAVILNKLDKDKFNRDKWIRQREKKEQQLVQEQQGAKNSKEEEEEEDEEPQKDDEQEPNHEENEQPDLPPPSQRESSMTYQEGELVFTTLQEVLKANPDLAIGLSLTEPALSEFNDNSKQHGKCNCNHGSCVIL